MRVECTKCGEKFDNRVGHKCAPRKSAPKAKTEAKTSPVLIRSLETLMAMKSSKPITAAGREKAARAKRIEPDKKPDKAAPKKAKPDKSDKARKPEISVTKPDKQAAKKKPAPVAQAPAQPDPKPEPICQPALNASTARSRKWREANRETDRKQQREYMREYRSRASKESAQ